MFSTHTSLLLNLFQPNGGHLCQLTVLPSPHKRLSTCYTETAEVLHSQSKGFT